ncbi:hypothetical protein MKX47_12455 [Solibacillus sp. FSL R7-0668]|uniref:hypothetical protein n=1 Tax=Solibacillus sp. FSL R7-0668 TaxID=2921688 RepID=UPI0030FC1296
MIHFEVEGQASVEHDPVLIDALVKLYHQKAPSSHWEGYQEGMQAGIRYALLALNVKIDGINAERG